MRRIPTWGHPRDRFGRHHRRWPGPGTGDDYQRGRRKPEVGIGIGGAIAILGGAFIVRSIIVRADVAHQLRIGQTALSRTSVCNLKSYLPVVNRHSHVRPIRPVEQGFASASISTSRYVIMAYKVILSQLIATGLRF